MEDDNNVIRPREPLPEWLQDFVERLPRADSLAAELDRARADIFAADKTRIEGMGSAMARDLRSYADPMGFQSREKVEALEAYRKSAEAYDARANEIADMVKANSCERETILEFSRLIRFGYKFIDIRVRKDGKEHDFQADFLARLFARKPTA